MNNLSLSHKGLLLSSVLFLTILAAAALLILIGLKWNHQAILDAGGILAIVYIALFRRIPVSRWLKQWLITSHSCEVCGNEIPLVGQWRCRCQFTSQPRSCYSACPRCSIGFDSILCSNCGTGHQL